MLCYVYKSLKKTDTYLFVNRKDDFTDISEALRHMLGALEFVMEVDLAGRGKLARLDSGQLRRHLDNQGYYLQLPPTTVFHRA